jgi:hypothetical protein
MAQLVRHDLGDICRRVEQVREPAHERCDLDLTLSNVSRETHDADPADGLGQVLDSLVNRPDDIPDLAARISAVWRGWREMEPLTSAVRRICFPARSLLASSM